jgi:hypothetical protein
LSPSRRKLLIGFLEGTLPAWRRFSKEFHAGSAINTLTPAEKLLISIPATNRGSQSWESTSILALIPASIFDQESTPESMFSGIDAESMFRLRSRNSMRINSRIGPRIDPLYNYDLSL